MRGGGGGIGGRVALGGGGLSVVGLVIYFLLSQVGGVSGGGGGTGGLGLGDLGSGQQITSSSLASQYKTGADANKNHDCAIVAIVNSTQDYWTSQFRPLRADLPQGAHELLQRRCADRLRQRDLGRRAVPLPGRLPGLHRPLVLQRAKDPLRRTGRAFH
jgi:predicted metalloprotease